MDQPRTPEDVKALAEEHGIRFIRLWFTDILGQLKSFSINAAELDDAFEGGMGFDGSSITGFNAIEESDMIAMPDPTTFAVLPWRPEDEGGGVARMFADIRTPEGEPYEGDPRHILRRAEERMHEMGFDHFNVGPELEYFLFRDTAVDRGARRGRLLRPHDARRRLRRPPRHRPRAREARHPGGVLPPRGRPEPARDRHPLRRRPEDRRRLHDLPDHGQGVRAQVRLARDVHAQAAVRRERLGHAHAPVAVQGRRNAFYDADDKYFLSDVGKAFIAGQLRHAREICSIFAQWVNSYKRLVPGYEAPVYVAWSRRNRSALVRVPLYHPGKEKATRMELRCPDPACNPYLTFAALLQAGLEGIEKGYELPEPMEKNLYHLAPDDRRRLGIEQLPETLGEAIELTAESELVLRTLGEHTFNRFVEIKRQEWEDYRVQVTPWELERYLGIL